MPCLLARSQAAGTAVSWSRVYGTVEACDPLPLLSPYNKPCMSKAWTCLYLAFCGGFFLWQWMGGLCCAGECCGGRGLQGCKAAVDVELLRTVLLPLYSPGTCCALAIESAGDKTDYSGTLLAPVEKKHFALTCFLLTPETRISRILTYHPYLFSFSTPSLPFPVQT